MNHRDTENTEKIKKIAGRLLAEKRVDAVIGFRPGTVSLISAPTVARTEEEAAGLHWDRFCGVNLANYLPKREDKIAIVAKGCDSRSIVGLVAENQIKRENLYIIGIPCTGMIDRAKVISLAESPEVELTENGEEVTIKADGKQSTVALSDILQDNCQGCLHRNPAVFDELVGKKVEEAGGSDINAAVAKVEAMSQDERWNHFDQMFSTCIRCYACRNACPLCYCEQCFADDSQPQWCGKSTNPVDVKIFHIFRAYHCAGRCTDCGACVRACPVGINVRELTGKLEKEVRELFGCEAGMSLEAIPPLGVYLEKDPQEFIK
ncbi:Coenzyme F420 hydrogenase/dehydrogenase, beta subunit C-terminal domain [bacterium]|nr:Coenzyme F420 hydrogenase/dehydrogenase, beta subunit C-terminal domain [bacterium]